MGSLEPIAFLGVEGALWEVEGVLVTHLQEALHSGAAVLSTAAIVSVRQENLRKRE